jgi:hypothetical protein
MPEHTTPPDPELLDWLDLSMLVAEQGGTEGLYWWMYVVGMDGTAGERLIRGRVAWARWGSWWQAKAQEQAS